MSQIRLGQKQWRQVRSGSFGPLQSNVPQAGRERLWVLTRPHPLALPVPAPFYPCTRTGPSLRPRLRPPVSLSSAWLRPPFPTRSRRPAAEGRGGPGGAALASGRGIRCGVTGKLVGVPGVSFCGSPGSAGRWPGSLPAPTFAGHLVPPSAPSRHGAAAGAQEVTNAGRGEKEGGGGG